MGFDTFQKFAFKFPAHGLIITVKCNQISPPRAAHCYQIPKAEPKKGTIKISPNKRYMFFLQLELYVLNIILLHCIEYRNLSGESPHFVSLNIPFLVKGTKKVSFTSIIQRL